MWLLDFSDSDVMIDLAGKGIGLKDSLVIRIREPGGRHEITYATVEDGRKAYATLKQAIHDNRPFVSMKEQGIPMASFEYRIIPIDVILVDWNDGVLRVGGEISVGLPVQVMAPVPLEVKATVENGLLPLDVRIQD